MGAFQRSDRGNLKEDLERVFRSSRLAERKKKAGTMSGWRAADVRDREGADGAAELLLLDEPSMGLAPIFVEKIFEIIHEINEQGTPILLVEQNALMALGSPTAATCSDRPDRAGRRGQRARPEQRVRKAYPGRVVERGARLR